MCMKSNTNEQPQITTLLRAGISTDISVQVRAALEKIRQIIPSDVTQHVSVVDEAFNVRLEKARQRNFDYISRLK